MSGSSFGKIFRVTTWGESHGPAVGAVIDGCPAGIPLTENDVLGISRQAQGPGRASIRQNGRKTDSVEILSGVFEGKTTGTPISMIVRNQDQRSRDYGEIAFSYRPGHADYTITGEIRIPRLQRRRPLFRPGNHRQGRSRRRSVAFSPELGITLRAYTKALGPYCVPEEEYHFSEIQENSFYMPNNAVAGRPANMFHR